jgi:hypothetical protein
MVTNDVQKIKFSDEEVAVLNEHLNAIEVILKNKTIQLTPTESKRFGKLGTENEKWSELVYHDVSLVAQLMPPFIDAKNWDELEKTRELLSTFTDRFKSITQLLVDSNRLIGFNIYKKCLATYKNAQMLFDEGVSGVKIYLDKWAIHFEKKTKETKVSSVKLS